MQNIKKDGNKISDETEDVPEGGVVHQPKDLSVLEDQSRMQWGAGFG